MWEAWRAEDIPAGVPKEAVAAARALPGPVTYSPGDGLPGQTFPATLRPDRVASVTETA